MAFKTWLFIGLLAFNGFLFFFWVLPLVLYNDRLRSAQVKKMRERHARGVYYPHDSMFDD